MQLCTDLFRRFDVDSNGSLNSEELTNLLTFVMEDGKREFTQGWLDTLVHDAYLKYDRNNTWSLEKREFLRFMSEFKNRDCIRELLEKVRVPLFFGASFSPHFKKFNPNLVGRRVEKLYKGIGRAFSPGVVTRCVEEA